jgi:peptide/nickel transport system permease protein
MGGYVVQRLAGVIAVIFGLIIFTFFATSFIGDPVEMMMDPELATEEDVAAVRAANGLDAPLPERFLRYMGNVLQGDFGESLWQNRPATEIVLERVPATLLLAGVTVAFSIVVSVGLALLATLKRGTWIEQAIFIGSTALACIPSFWLALALIIVLAVRLSVFPTSGYGEPINIVLPVLAISAQPIGYLTQVLHSGLKRDVSEQYTRTARAKGLTESAILVRHVFRNTAILATTMVGAMIATLVNGTVLAESVFAWPGIGDLSLQAVHQRDLPVLTAVIFYAGVTVALINMVVDLVYARLDPRIRLK